MGSLKPFTNIDGLLFGVNFPNNPLPYLDEIAEVIGGHRYFKSNIANVVSWSYFPEEPEPVLVNTMKESIPILTQRHSPKCPYCMSPVCLHKWSSRGWISCMLRRDLGKTCYLFRLCKCKNENKYFLKVNAPKQLFFKNLGCIYCGSKEIVILARTTAVPDIIDWEKLRRLRWKKIENEKNRYWKGMLSYYKKRRYIDVIKYLCIHCKIQSICFVAETDVGTIIQEIDDFGFPSTNFKYAQASLGETYKIDLDNIVYY